MPATAFRWRPAGCWPILCRLSGGRFGIDTVLAVARLLAHRAPARRSRGAAGHGRRPRPRIRGARRTGPAGARGLRRRRARPQPARPRAARRQALRRSAALPRGDAEGRDALPRALLARRRAGAGARDQSARIARLHARRDGRGRRPERRGGRSAERGLARRRQPRGRGTTRRRPPARPRGPVRRAAGRRAHRDPAGRRRAGVARARADPPHAPQGRGRGSQRHGGRPPLLRGAHGRRSGRRHGSAPGRRLGRSVTAGRSGGARAGGHAGDDDR